MGTRLHCCFVPAPKTYFSENNILWHVLALLNIWGHLAIPCLAAQMLAIYVHGVLCAAASLLT